MSTAACEDVVEVKVASVASQAAIVAWTAERLEQEKGIFVHTNFLVHVLFTGDASWARGHGHSQKEAINYCHHYWHEIFFKMQNNLTNYH